MSDSDNIIDSYYQSMLDSIENKSSTVQKYMEDRDAFRQRLRVFSDQASEEELEMFPDIEDRFNEEADMFNRIEEHFPDVTIMYAGGVIPFQMEGFIGDDYCFYGRYRHSGWSIELLDLIDYTLSPEDLYDRDYIGVFYGYDVVRGIYFDDEDVDYKMDCEDRETTITQLLTFLYEEMDWEIL